MTTRITDPRALEGAAGQMMQLEQYLHQSGLDEHLIELVKLRVSQINGCAFCLAMHARLLREAGEREDRLHVLAAWRETGWFSERERAALAWAEAVTLLKDQHVADAVYEDARAQFSEKELADLTLTVITINGWNRLNIALQMKAPEPFELAAADVELTAQ